MLDNSPWFRRWMQFSFFPVTWKGWATIAGFLLLEVLLALIPVETESLAWWLVAAMGFAVFLGFWAFCLWKTDAN
jgi:hypothetical protein